VLGTAVLEARVAFVADRRVASIQSDPAVNLDSLVGVRASSGFRQAVDAALASEEPPASILYQLLDDVPTAVLVSGYALGAGGVHPPRGSIEFHNHADICAGWATGATILSEAADTGYVPVVTGPEAPELSTPDDPLGWHPVDPLPPIGMRRWRRIDVWPGDDRVLVECFFRDSHVNEEGLETVVHEYVVKAALDRETSRFISCEARVGALPWLECPLAAPSAQRLVGTAAAELRGWVRDNLTGISTCTHLNDTLRSMACVPYLVARLEEGS
jgi:Protein of unknown function (DUF2889)